MKLQNLAIIFVIIILPISLILTSYMSNKVQTLSLQIAYDTALDNATYDSIKAFQMNTTTSSTSSLANSRLRDLEASANTFLNSASNRFGMAGYSKTALQSHIPALVYILYDGYYIYSPYTNTLDKTALEQIEKDRQEEMEHPTSVEWDEDIDINNGDTIIGLKPYVYYSCRYKRAGSFDVVISYTLDSYITIRGTVGGKTVNESGYLLSSAKRNGAAITYRNVTIDEEPGYRENIWVDGSVQNLRAKKINGMKYYEQNNGKVFYLENGKKMTIANQVFADQTLNVNNNDNAVNYYGNAYDLKQKIFGAGGSLNALRDLNVRDAIGMHGENLVDSELIQAIDNQGRIFGELDASSGQVQIEDSNSNFNAHRLDIIKYCVEKNLSVAIGNFNDYSNASVNFQMPRLKDYEWEEVANNVGLISFLQGLTIGGKMYNGYSIVTNTKNNEFVSEDSIFILAKDGTYYNPKDSIFNSLDISHAVGIFNMDREPKTALDEANLSRYYLNRETYLGNPVVGSYSSIVSRNDILDRDIHDIMKGNANLAKIYYTALGRERYGIYHISE